MEANIYLGFYDNSKLLGFWRTALIYIFTRSKVNHVGLIFEFPFVSLTPILIDGAKSKLSKEHILEKKGCKLIYKKYMGTADICVEEIKNLVDKQKIPHWYKCLFWVIIGRWFNYEPVHCGTFAANWLNTNLHFNLKNGAFPYKLLQEVKNDYTYDWW